MSIVFITGANRGLGLALTQATLARGDDVIATCRKPESATALHALAKKNNRLTILALDVTDQASIARLVTELTDEPIDVLINNAGILSGSDSHLSAMDSDPSQLFGSIDPQAWLRVIHANTVAPIMVTQALLPNLKASPTRKIAMISSRWGSIESMDDQVPIAYGSSKAALNFAMKNIAMSLQKDGFVVVSLNPGWVKTDMGSQEADLTSEESTSCLLRVIDALTPEKTGQFIRHTGELIPW